MGLQLILGSSGTGKTTAMYNEMIEMSRNIKGVRYLAVVPEQFTMETQKTIVNLSPEKGTMDIDILSFDRLAKRIFEEAGLNSLEVLDDTGKCLIIRKIIEENKSKLTVFGSKVKMVGFIDEMKSMISELYQYGIGEKELNDMLEKSLKKPLLYAKLEDIKLIIEQLKLYLKDRFVMNEELLQRVCELIPESKVIKDSYITFDEYTGFSPVQYNVIKMLLKYASKVTVALTIREPDKIDYGMSDNELDVFGITIKTVNKLKKTAIDENVEIYSDIILKTAKRFGEIEELKYLEENLFKFGKKPFKVNNKDNISIHVCSNISDEAEYVAYTAKKLVREKGYRYKDIAVVTADVENYHRVITETFAKHDIPCFIDYKRSIIANPMVESLRAILEMITENYSYETVFRFLKCGMSTLERRETDKLENYVIRYGIRGFKRYSKEFDTEDDTVNEARKKLLADTGEIYGAFKIKKRISVKEAITALYKLTVQLKMESKLAVMEKYFAENGNLSMAKEYAQTYGKVMTLFDKTVFLIGDEEINAKELAAILDSGFEDIKVGIIPPTLDRMVIGDIERTRLSNVKILFLIGGNDGIIPKREIKGGVLTQNERNFLLESEVELSPTAKENVFIQKYYLYLMLTKMSNKLFISFKRINGDGSSARPSYLINNLVKMFNGIRIVDEENIKKIERITNIKSAVSSVSEEICDYIGDELNDEKEKFFRELYSACVRHNVNMTDIINAAIFENKPTKIDSAIARLIYGENMHNSISRLEKYAACAYQHFMNFGLNLAPRREYEVNNADIGSIYHESIELFSRKIVERNISWDELDDELRDSLISESVDEAVKESGNEVFSDNARNAFTVERIRKMAKKTAWILQKQIVAGEFIPRDFEVRFSSDYGLEELKYIYENGCEMGIRGIIDRVDYYNSGDDIYVKIVDYKSGNKKFEINDVYYGLQLQLVVYMEAAMSMVKKNNPDKNVIPAGIFYYNIDNPVIDGSKVFINQEVINKPDGEKDEAVRKCADELVLKQQRVEGLVNCDDKVLKALDKNIDNIKENGGDSTVVPVGFTKKGTYKSGSQNTTDFDMDNLIRYVHNKIGLLGEEILKGDIDINPYIKTRKNGGESSTSIPCIYCEYKSVCGFDKKIKGYNYRTLFTLDKDEAWKQIRQEVERASSSDEAWKQIRQEVDEGVKKDV